MRYFFLVRVSKKNPLALRAFILKLFWMGKKLNSFFQGIKLKRGHQIFYFHYIEKKKIGSRFALAYLSCFGRGKVKIIISGNQFKKRASNSLFLSGHCIEKNPLALRARILKLFWMRMKLNSLFQGIKLKRGHPIRLSFALAY